MRRERGGTYRLVLQDWELDLLRNLAPQMRHLLSDGSDPALRRLFPTAYPDDDALEEEYRDLVGDDLLEGRLGALDVVEATVDEGRIDDAEATAWLQSLNGIRLLLGTRLDVGEDHDPGSIPDDHPDATEWQIYDYLSGLLWELTEAMSESL